MRSANLFFFTQPQEMFEAWYQAQQNTPFEEKEEQFFIEFQQKPINYGTITDTAYQDSLYWKEQHLYGSSRLGIAKPELEVTNYKNSNFSLLTSNFRNYELTNHLGNVLATIKDEKQQIDQNADGIVDYYEPIVITANDYYPFGMVMPNRQYSLTSYKYRFGYQGSEKDDETYGEGNAYTTHFRALDVRLGRWFSTDPEEDEMPWQSPYNSMDGNPILKNDPNGDCPTCITALVGAVVGAGVELGGQIVSNVATGKEWNDIDYADVGIAALEGGVIGLTGGLGVAGKIGKTAIKVVNTSTKIIAATGQGAVDAKQKKFGGTQTVLGDKSLGDAAIDAGVNFVGAAAGGKAPSGSKKVKGPLPKTPTPKEAVKKARETFVVKRADRIKIETKAKSTQKAINIANETLREVGIPGAAIENVSSDGLKDVLKK